MFRSVWCEVGPVSKLYWYKTKKAIPKTNPSTELHSDHYKAFVVGIWKWTLSPFIMLTCKCYNTWQITHFLHRSKGFLRHTRTNLPSMYIVNDGRRTSTSCLITLRRRVTVWWCVRLWCRWFRLFGAAALHAVLCSCTRLRRSLGWWSFLAALGDLRLRVLRVRVLFFHLCHKRKRKILKGRRAEEQTLNATIENLCIASQIKVKKKPVVNIMFALYQTLNWRRATLFLQQLFKEWRMLYMSIYRLFW